MRNDCLYKSLPPNSFDLSTCIEILLDIIVTRSHYFFSICLWILLHFLQILPSYSLTISVVPTVLVEKYIFTTRLLFTNLHASNFHCKKSRPSLFWTHLIPYSQRHCTLFWFIQCMLITNLYIHQPLINLLKIKSDAIFSIEHCIIAIHRPFHVFPCTSSEIVLNKTFYFTFILF
jgi:hypothetical protein